MHHAREFSKYLWTKAVNAMLKKKNGMYPIFTYVLLIKEVVLSVLAGAAHVLQQRRHVPLPVIHYYKTNSPISYFKDNHRA